MCFYEQLSPSYCSLFIAVNSECLKFANFDLVVTIPRTITTIRSVLRSALLPTRTHSIAFQRCFSRSDCNDMHVKGIICASTILSVLKFTFIDTEFQAILQTIGISSNTLKIPASVVEYCIRVYRYRKETVNLLKPRISRADLFQSSKTSASFIRKGKVYCHKLS